MTIIGNGVSLLILGGIVSRVPSLIGQGFLAGKTQALGQILLLVIIALVVVAVLLFVAVVLLSNAFGSVATENSIREKIAAFDAAEAGMDQVIEVLDADHGRSTECATASAAAGRTVGNLADGGSYRWCIAYNGVVNGAGRIADHANGQNEIAVANNRVFAWSSEIGRAHV